MSDRSSAPLLNLCTARTDVYIFPHINYYLEHVGYGETNAQCPPGVAIEIRDPILDATPEDVRAALTLFLKDKGFHPSLSEYVGDMGVVVTDEGNEQELEDRVWRAFRPILDYIEQLSLQEPSYREKVALRNPLLEFVKGAPTITEWGSSEGDPKKSRLFAIEITSLPGADPEEVAAAAWRVIEPSLGAVRNYGFLSCDPLPQGLGVSILLSFGGPAPDMDSVRASFQRIETAATRHKLEDRVLV